ncbi:MAG: twin-arginine translocase TatA/TatE family subunit [Verrucomicrobiota bacterium]
MDGMFAFLGVGGPQLLLLMGAVLLLFGPKKLPELARGLGKGIREFKKASSEVTDELERTFDDPPSKFPPEGSSPHDSVPRALPEAGSSPVPEEAHSARLVGEVPPK